MNADERLDVIRRAFPGSPVEVESGGDHGDRILVHRFLSVEPRPVRVRTLVREVVVDGWMACLDNGMDVEYLYEGVSFANALKEMACALARWRVDVAMDQEDPCLVPIP